MAGVVAGIDLGGRWGSGEVGVVVVTVVVAHAGHVREESRHDGRTIRWPETRRRRAQVAVRAGELKAAHTVHKS